MTHEPHPASTPTGWNVSLKPKRRAKSLEKYYSKCSHRSPCGGECILNGNLPHVYHTCRKEACQYCHGWERFKVRR